MNLSEAIDLTMPCSPELLARVAGRYWPKVDKAGECWIWTASLDAYGYGQLHSVNGKRPYRAHRLALYLSRGPVAGDLHVDHLCRNRACVNPDHLELVTQAENNRRAAAVRVKHTHCPRGHEMEVRTSRRGHRRTVCKPCHRETSRKAYRQEVESQWT